MIFSIGSSAQTFSEQSSAFGVDHSFRAKGLMGGGAIFFDADQDGDEDLYLNGGLNRDDLYLNNGSGQFAKAGNNNGLEVTLQYNTTASISGDIDNDGDRDLFVCTWETSSDIMARNLLFVNNGDGTFSEVGATTGITQAAFTIGANFLDYNRDGYLDIHVINHIEQPGFLFDSTGLIVGFDHDCFANFFYRNNGDGTFSEVASQLGTDDSGCALAALASDYDLDGDVDVFIANDFGPFLVPNILYQNDYPNDAFRDVSNASGAGIPMYGMGITAGDYDQDLDLDYYITNLGTNVLLENRGGNFVDVAGAAQVESTFAALDSSEFATGWGTAFFDIDNDTWLDLFVANGRIPSLSTLPTAVEDANRLYYNNGDKTFSEVTEQSGVGDTGYGRGMAYADIDADGDLDFVLINQNEFGGKTKFYRNDSDNGNHFVQFHLVGKESNRDAYGAKLWLHAGGQTFLREIDGGGGSFCSQSSSIVHYGLGDIDQVDSLRIDWPNGHVDHLGSYAIDERHTIEEGFVTSTRDLVGSGDWTISPKPLPGRQLAIATAASVDEDYELTLFSVTGQVMLRQELRLQTGTTTLLLPEELAAGYYSLQLRSRTQRELFKLIVP